MREYFMKSERIGFSKWTENDLSLAEDLWGSTDVTHFICASGRFTIQDIKDRLQTEINNGKRDNMQYWPIFELKSGKFIGCCGIRPFKDEADACEIGCHLKKSAWRHGYAKEACMMVIKYAFNELHKNIIYVGHHPKNTASQKLVKALGFDYIGDNYYEPTGLYHPSYKMTYDNLK